MNIIMTFSILKKNKWLKAPVRYNRPVQIFKWVIVCLPLLLAGGMASLRLGRFWRRWLAASSLLSCAVWWSLSIWLKFALRVFCCRSRDSNKSSLIDNFLSIKFTPSSKFLNISGICLWKQTWNTNSIYFISNTRMGQTFENYENVYLKILPYTWGTQRALVGKKCTLRYKKIIVILGDPGIDSGDFGEIPKIPGIVNENCVGIPNICVKIPGFFLWDGIYRQAPPLLYY